MTGRVWHILRSRFRSLAFSGRRESELNEELGLHLERETERLRALGLSQDEARFQALRLFGGVEQVKEECRDTRGTASFDALVRDARYGVRRLGRDWRFTLAAVLILGLAIGANTAIFSLVNAVLFRHQAFADPDRLVNIYQNDPAGRPLVVASYATYARIAEYTDLFAGTAAATIPLPARYLHGTVVRDAMVEYATATYLDTLGLRPSLGRWFERTEERPAAPLVAVLGHQAWTRMFRADPLVIGRVVRLDGKPVTIVGVGPANYRGTVDIGLATDFWLPVTALPATAASGIRGAATIHAPFLVKARLHDGVTVAQAATAMEVLGRRLDADVPEDHRSVGELAVGKGITVLASTAVRIHPQADASVATLASLVLVIVGLVLAIACSNLATLLLVRGAARSREVAVRLAMGARRHDLIRQLLMESLLIALAGGVIGCVVAWWSIRIFQGLDLPVRVDLSLDYRVLAFVVALSVVTGVAFGLAPALKSTKVDLVSTLRDEALPPVDRRRLTLKNSLIVVQVAVSVLFLGGASISLQQSAAARAHRVGYAVDGVSMIETDLRFAGYAESAALTVCAELLRRITVIPGVESAALLRGLPMAAATVPIVLDGPAAAAETAVEASMIASGPGFFETLRIPLVAGRVFDAHDRADTPRVAVVTETLARRHFGGANAVGRRFRLANDPDSWTEVIGVVRDTGTGSFANDVLDPIAPAFYTSYTQSGELPTTVIARTSADAAALVRAMERELRALNVTLPVMTATTMAEKLKRAESAPAAVAACLAVLASLGLVLASIGLYAIVAFAVGRRTREIGIRMALGAQRRQVVWSIARGVAGLVALGTGIGLVLSVVAALVLRASSGDVGIGNLAVYHPRIEPWALLVIAAVTALVAVVAAFVPGRRAARLDPFVALRHE